jgi:hypothetical protein
MLFSFGSRQWSSPLYRASRFIRAAFSLVLFVRYRHW